jgi:PEP-CTERM motif
MQETSQSLRIRPISLALALAFCGAPMVTQAAAINLTAEQGPNGGPRTALIPQGGSYPYPASGADFYGQGGITGGGTYFFHTYGFASGTTYFGARASGDANFDLSTSATYTDTVSTFAGALISFTFNVDSGNVGLFGNGTGSSSLLLRVKANGVEISSNQTTITLGAGGFACSDSGVGALDAYMGCASSTSNVEFGSGGSFTVSFLADAANVNIEYDIVATTSGIFTSGGATSPGYGDACYGQGGGGEGLAAAAYGTPTPFCPFFNGISRSGDPFGLPTADFAPIQANFSIDITGLVPEPGSLALLAAGGIGGLVARRRARRQAAG